jgi:hypothetical protein
LAKTNILWCALWTQDFHRMRVTKDAREKWILRANLTQIPISRKVCCAYRARDIRVGSSAWCCARAPHAHPVSHSEHRHGLPFCFICIYRYYVPIYASWWKICHPETATCHWPFRHSNSLVSPSSAHDSIIWFWSVMIWFVNGCSQIGKDCLSRTFCQ